MTVRFLENDSDLVITGDINYQLATSIEIYREMRNTTCKKDVLFVRACEDTQ